MKIELNNREVRVLGCLMEKSMVTPEVYPLSLNALINACNQKSNRKPVVSWDENTVQDTADTLERKGWVNRSLAGRVPRYEECLTRQLNMVAAEAAALCVLLLRGAQTPGQIRSRTDRMYAFDSLEGVQETLNRLMEWGLARKLDLVPGHKEARYAHLLGEVSDAVADSDEEPVAPLEKRMRALETALADLGKRVDALERRLDSDARLK